MKQVHVNKCKWNHQETQSKRNVLHTEKMADKQKALKISNHQPQSSLATISN